MAAVNEKIKSQTSLALTAAQEFAKLYHEMFDKRRDKIGRLYLEEADVVWNGNPFKGRETIVEFFNSLPSSQHCVEALDTQPIIAVTSYTNTSTIIITMFGRAKFMRDKWKSFSQTILLASQEDNKWKIVSDNYRFVE